MTVSMLRDTPMYVTIALNAHANLFKIFGVVTPGSKYAAPLIGQLQVLGTKSIAIAYSSDGFSTSVKNGALTALADTSITILDQEVSYYSILDFLIEH